MFCLYKNCDHSVARNSCVFIHFPTEDCAFRIWKRYAGISQRRLNAVKEPLLCSCHFTQSNDFPIPYALEDKTRTATHPKPLEKHKSGSNSPHQQKIVALYDFDESLYEIEDFVNLQPSDDVEKKDFLLEVVNRQSYEDFESNRHNIPGSDGETAVFNVELVTSNQKCSIETSSPTFLNEIITGT